MPSSYVDSVPPIIKLLERRKPKRVIDIGPGWGKYGLMCREYFGASVDAIEVPQGRSRDERLARIQDVVYDEIWVGDMCTTRDQFWSTGGWDTALMIDVIEHVSIEDGLRVVNNILACGLDLVVSTPKVFIEQSDPLNPHETHVSLWKHDSFGIMPLYDYSTPDSIIYLFGEPRGEEGELHE